MRLACFIVLITCLTLSALSPVAAATLAQATHRVFAELPPNLHLTQTIPDTFDPDDRALADLMEALLGAVAGSEPSARTVPSPTLAPLGARLVDLQGMNAADLIDLLLPSRLTE